MLHPGTIGVHAPACTGGASPRSSAGGHWPRRRRGTRRRGIGAERPHQAARDIHGQRRAAGGMGVPARQPPRRAPGRPRPPRGSSTWLRRGGVRTCTVLLDGEPVSGCLLLAVQADGHRCCIARGLSPGRRAPPAAGVLPAQRGGAVRLLHARHAAHRLGAAAARRSAERWIRRELVGNLCRCTGYTKILDVVEEHAAEAAEERGGHA